MYTHVGCEEALAVFKEQKAEKEEAQSYRKDSKFYYPIKVHVRIVFDMYGRRACLICIGGGHV